MEAACLGFVVLTTGSRVRCGEASPSPEHWPLTVEFLAPTLAIVAPQLTSIFLNLVRSPLQGPVAVLKLSTLSLSCTFRYCSIV